MIIQILLTALISVLALVVMHYLPWRSMIQHDTHNLFRYVTGVSGIAIPLSGLLVAWEEWYSLLALWVITIASGIAVSMSYLLDAWLIERAKRQAAEGAENVLRKTE